ncbi:MAG TPA: peptidylprolyl isomerase [Allosphingosinicella sp.]|nr:peptidylprolyl isomerase [Allosphingosinicella sp.]
MIRPLLPLAVLLLLPGGCGDTSTEAPATSNNSTAAAAPRTQEPLPDIVRVRLETEAGAIVVALDHRRAPLTTANFVRYVDAGRFDGTTFYRASRTPGSQGRGFIQGGIRRDVRRMYPAILHEPTSETGLRHREGAISMARAEMGAGAIGDFFITASAMPSLDARRGAPGYAVFGRVEEGMDVVRRILAAPTAADRGRGAMRGQMLERPVRIVRARRVD